jgi:hypothetical protein
MRLFEYSTVQYIPLRWLGHFFCLRVKKKKENKRKEFIVVLVKMMGWEWNLRTGGVSLQIAYPTSNKKKINKK